MSDIHISLAGPQVEQVGGHQVLLVGEMMGTVFSWHQRYQHGIARLIPGKAVQAGLVLKSRFEAYFP